MAADEPMEPPTTQPAQPVPSGQPTQPEQPQQPTEQTQPTQPTQPESGTEPAIAGFIRKHCIECHGADEAEGGLDLTKLSFPGSDSLVRERWVLIHDRIKKQEMPPDARQVAPGERAEFLARLHASLQRSDLRDVMASGRGPIRRLNRHEYEQTLRDLLHLPKLDIRDHLPEDRESQFFHKTTNVLDISRVQLSAYLDAAEAALLMAVASGPQPPSAVKFQARSRDLFAETSTFGNREAMFFARDGVAISDQQLSEIGDDPTVEMALFRSAHWPYYGYPRGFIAPRSGDYRVRFSARAVRQLPGLKLETARRPVPLTFRARKPSGPDVSGDVRATGGLMDVLPERREYETVIELRAGETFEYSLLGLPVPLARNVDGGPPTYRYPPLPADGQPGIAFQSLEVEGPLLPAHWPPASHRVLFDELPISPAPSGSRVPVRVESKDALADARRLMNRFIDRAARRPISTDERASFLDLVASQLERGQPLAESLLTGYQAFLCSTHFLFLDEPRGELETDHHAIASRLSYFLGNTSPDARLSELAGRRELRKATVLREETLRLIEAPGFDRFVEHFTDDWLGLRHIHRDEPDARLYPEYRFDAYLVESLARESREFVRLMLRENLPASALVSTDFILVNDRLAEHYGLPPVSGSGLRKVSLPADSPLGGLLTQGAILKVTANGTNTSPVVRGAWVMSRLVGEPPPPPPAAVPAVEPDIRGAKSIRELLDLHTRSEACRGCHERFDPVGVALENFDVLGRWRTRYRGLETSERVTGIDRAGHDFSYGLGSEVDARGRLLVGGEFADVRQLKQLLLRDTRQLARNLLYLMTVYSTGTPVRYSDRAEIETVLDRCAGDGFRARDLLVALVQSRVFLGHPGAE